MTILKIAHCKVVNFGSYLAQRARCKLSETLWGPFWMFCLGTTCLFPGNLSCLHTRLHAHAGYLAACTGINGCIAGCLSLLLARLGFDVSPSLCTPSPIGMDSPHTAAFSS